MATPKPTRKQEIRMLLIGFGFFILSMPVITILADVLKARARDAFGGEREGFAKYEDCREIVKLKDNPIQALYKTFTCDYQRTPRGDLVGGKCVHIELDSGRCTVALVYEKTSTLTCGEHARATTEGTCECEMGLIFDPQRKGCSAGMSQSTPLPATPPPGTKRMKAPNGDVRDIPLARVDELKSEGAVEADR